MPKTKPKRGKTMPAKKPATRANTKKTTASRKTTTRSNGLLPKLQFNKRIAIVLVLLFASVGGYLVFRSRAAVPAVTIKDTNYAIPAGAKFVSTSGSDTNTGTEASPWQTIQKAINSTATGGTIVIRGGTYRQPKIVINGKALTLQPYPHEKVWVKGSVEVTGWVADGSTWRKDGWSYKFARVEVKQPNEQVDSAYPLAGYPDMVFTDGVPLKQVATRGEVVAGTFYVDEANQKLYMGDNPSGKLVEGTAQANLLELYNASNSKVLGLGFAHAASKPDAAAGAVVAHTTSHQVLFENNTFAYNAAIGMEVGQTSDDVVVRGNQFVYNGMVGAGTWGNPRRLVFEQNYVGYNNQERFSVWWSAAGIKMVPMIEGSIRDNTFENNLATGIWCDIGCTNVNIVRNRVQNNDLFGIFYEISDGGIIASNLVVNNNKRGGAGIYVSESPNVKVYNNTVANNQTAGVRSIDVNSHARKTTTNTVIKNNILSHTSSSNLWIVRVQDDLGNNSADSMVSAMDYNAYYRKSSTAPPIVVAWGIVGGRSDYTTLAQFQSAKGHETSGLIVENNSTNPFFTDEAGGDYSLKSGSVAIGRGEALPADVAAAIGVTAGVPVNIGALAWPTPTTSTTDTAVPSATTDLTATAKSSSQIDLSWTAATDNTGVTGYDVYRASTKLTTVAATSYSDTGLAASTGYSYYVIARDAAGNSSAQSNIVTATTQANTATPADTTAPSVTIASPVNNAKVGRSTSIKATASDNTSVTKMEVYTDGVLRTTSTTGSISYTWNTRKLTAGAHTITVKAYDAAGNAGQSSVTVYK